jgi:hypothetical protein
VALAANRDRYIAGLTDFREDRLDAWLEHLANASARAARLAAEYIGAIGELTEGWRAALATSPKAPRADAAAGAIIDVLPGHPIITAPVAAVATGRSRPQIYQAVETLEAAGVLIPLSQGRRNRSWEAAGLLDISAGLEAGRPL